MNFPESLEMLSLALRKIPQKKDDDDVLSKYKNLLFFLNGNPSLINDITPNLHTYSPEDLLSYLKYGNASMGDFEANLHDGILYNSICQRVDSLKFNVRQRLHILSLFHGFANSEILSAMCRLPDTPELLRNINKEEWEATLDLAESVGLAECIDRDGLFVVHPAMPWFFRGQMEEFLPDLCDWLRHAYVKVYGSFGHQLQENFTVAPELSIKLLAREEDNLLYAISLGKQFNLWNDISGAIEGIEQLWTIQGRRIEWEQELNDTIPLLLKPDLSPKSECVHLWNLLQARRVEILCRHNQYEEAKRICLSTKNYVEKNLGKEGVGVLL